MLLRPHDILRSALRVVPVVLLGVSAFAAPARAAWRTYGGDAQHTAVSTVPAQALQVIHWQTPVDLWPQYTGTILYIHYGSPLVTEANTVIFPVKTGATDGFVIEARDGGNGALRWVLGTDYLLPPHNWTPSVGTTLTPQGRLYWPGAGGTVFWADALDTPETPAATRVAFYGDGAYAINKAGMDAGLFVSTPITSDAHGRVFFGVRSVGTNPLAIASALVRLDPNGQSFVFSPAAATAGAVTEVAMNCAPALSADEQTVYHACRGATSSPGYLMAIDVATMTLGASRLLVDPVSASPARVSNDGTSSPMVGPDGRVYFGVLENPPASNASRGWLLQFDGVTLAPAGAPGAFGWDDTPSVVPVSAVPGYAGPASYLLMTKYNYYAGSGDGVNKIAVLDPDATQVDAHAGATVMKEIRVIAGVTPDPDVGPAFPNAVKEWCINTAAIDPFTRSVLAGSEDGKLYRWDLVTNTFTQSVVLTPGLGEAYTPTLVGPDGQVYAINNATLFAVGAAFVGAPPRGPLAGVTLVLPQPNPFAAGTTLRFTLAHAQPVTLEVVDVTGQRVATLWSGEACAGEHVLRWDGRDTAGALRPAGMYFARLAAGGNVQARKLLLVR
jgi:hypothetical protein